MVVVRVMHLGPDGRYIPALESECRHRGKTAVDSENLPGDVFSGVACEKHGGALEIVTVTQSLKGNARDHFVDPDRLDEALRHPRRKEARRDRIHSNTVPPPTSGQSAGEVDDRSLACAVAYGLRGTRTSQQSRDRCDVEDPTIPVRNH